MQPNAMHSFCITTNRICYYEACQGGCDLCPLCLISDCIDYWVPNEELIPPSGEGVGTGGNSGQGGNGRTGAYAPVVQALATKIPISAPQLDWLNNNQPFAYELIEMLVDENEIEGDGTNAILSYASAIPIAGWYASGLKFAKKTVNITGTSVTALKWTRRIDNIINFGDRRQLRRVIGLITGESCQAHHIIPWEFTEDIIVQTAAKAPGTNAFHKNELLNGIALNKSIHVEGMVHTTNNTRVRAALDDIITN